MNKNQAKADIVSELRKYMEEHNLNKVQMAQQINIPRCALDRLLDENNTSLTCKTLLKIAKAMGKRVVIEFVY